MPIRDLKARLGSFALLLVASSGSAVGITVTLAALTLSSPAAVPDMGMLA